MKLAPLYAIVDRHPGASFAEFTLFVEGLIAGGVTLLQYRNKKGSAADILAESRALMRLASSQARANGLRIIMNDRTDLCLAAAFDGVHLGQEDLSPRGARTVLKETHIVGVSTHNLAQVDEAEASAVDYIAFGPVFATGSKQNPDPVVGLEGLKAARARTKKPLVAIGGITVANCRQVVDAGADSVAVISALAGRPRHAAEEFLNALM